MKINLFNNWLIESLAIPGFKMVSSVVSNNMIHPEKRFLKWSEIFTFENQCSKEVFFYGKSVLEKVDDKMGAGVSGQMPLNHNIEIDTCTFNSELFKIRKSYAVWIIFFSSLRNIIIWNLDVCSLNKTQLLF